jgi:hypothetical protein
MTRLQKHRAFLLFIALMIVAIAIELVCAWLAYHTIGEIVSSLMFLVVALNIVPIVLFAVRKQAFAVLVALVLVAAIVPYQAVLGYRLIAVQQEAVTVISYLYETKLHTGEYPADLSGYSFHDPSLSPFFHQYSRSAEHGGFTLCWYVGTPNTSHSYTPIHGWGYYPD